MRALRILLPVLIVASLGAAAWYYFTTVRANRAGGTIRVSGNIELTAVEVSFKVPGLVVERRFDEGQEVPGGEVVAVLDRAELEAQLAVRMAELKTAEAAWEEVQNGSREEDKKAAEAAMRMAAAAWEEAKTGSRQQEIDAARATMESAVAEVGQAADEFERGKRLFSQGAMATEVFNRLRTVFEVAQRRQREATQRYELVRLGPREEQKQQAQAAYDRTRWQYQLVMAGPREEERKQAQSRLEQARAAVQLAQAQLAYATAYAPREAVDKSRPAPRWVALSKNVEPGEVVAAGTPVLTLGDMRNVWLRAYIEETDLTRIKPGVTKARVTTDARPAKVYEGVVAFVAEEAEFTPKNVQTEKERTRLVYRIKINIDNPDLELKRGMPADAELLTETEPPQTAR